MNPERINALLAEHTAELAAMEPEWRALEQRRDILQGLIDHYRKLLTLSMPAGSNLPRTISIIHTGSNGNIPGVKISRSSPDNSTARVLRILKAASSDYLSTRDILQRMEADGWTTQSEHKIRMLRSILHTVRGRHPEIEFEQRGDEGALFYRWVDGKSLATHASGVSGREEEEG